MGKQRDARALAMDLERDFALGYRVAGFRSLDDAPASLEGADEVVVCAKGAREDEIAGFVAGAHRVAPAVTLVPEFGFLPFGSGSSHFLLRTLPALFDDRGAY